MRIRLEAVFLASVFLAGGFGLPAFDVARYHLHGANPRSEQPQISALGTPLAHVYSCILDQHRAAPRLLPSRPGAIVSVPSADLPSLRPPSVAKLPFFLETACRPRAPPIQSS